MNPKKRLFGTIIKLPSGNYKGKYKKDGKEYYTPTTTTKSQTQKQLDLAHAKILLNQWQPPKTQTQTRKEKTTVKQLTQKYIQHHQNIGSSPNTLRTYKSALETHLHPKHGNKNPNKITQNDIQTLLNNLTTKYTSKTIKNIKRALSAYFTYAQKHGYVTQNPVTNTETPTSNNTQTTHTPTALTNTQLHQLIQHTPDHLKLFIALGSWCALRYSEIAPLTPQDINTQNWTVTINKAVKRGIGGTYTTGKPKTKAANRTIAIPQTMHETVINHYKNHVKPDQTLLFHNPPHPQNYYTDKTIRETLYETLQTLHLPKIRFHDLRHTGLTLYGQTGATLADLMHRAGHTSPDTVMIYQRATLDRDTELANKMS